jgi:hypothetical protein
MPLKGLPVRDAPPVAGATASPLKDILDRADASPELSPHAREHLALVSAIAAGALQDLETVRDDVDKLRVEIMLRARLIAEATAEFDKLVRSAGRGYALIRQSLDMVREKFSAAMMPIPKAPGAEQKQTSPGD